MKDKQKRLLDEMIAIYIKDQEPIGSESLRLSVDMKISSATIRNYFKVLVSEGILFQAHSSSGKIPTNSALKSYWRAQIDTANPIDIGDLRAVAEASREHKIFCNIKIAKEERLRELVNFADKYSILVFDTTEAIVPYTRHLHDFLRELLDQDIESIKMIAKSVCANALCEKLAHISADKIYNFGFEGLGFIKDLNVVLSLIEGRIYYELRNGFHFDLFDGEHLGILQDVRLSGASGRMFVAGSLRQDYLSFYKKIAA